MEKTIVSAMNCIDEILAISLRLDSDPTRSRLVDTYNLLKQLLEPNLLKHYRTELFCRELKRLMNIFNKSLEKFWTKRYDEILFILEESNVRRDTVNRCKDFIERLNLEKEVKQRESEYQKTIEEQMGLYQLVDKHQQFFTKYLQKCISLHSKLQVQDLMENTNAFIEHSCSLTEITFGSEQRLKEKLKCTEIYFDCPVAPLLYLDSRFLPYNNSSMTAANSFSNFLPSREPLGISNRDNIIPQTIWDALKGCRWLVILGDPGSAKTTSLRWITRVFAETVCNREEEIKKKDKRIRVRIPILIRIGEFAAWLGQQHQSKTLLDYIGEHTWFLERYCDDQGKNVLKQLIDHGHALILIDGLDEIVDVKERSNIVNHVRNFIDEYVRTPNFFSAFDPKTFSKGKQDDCYDSDLRMHSPSEFGGNQIVITSRIVGYFLYPIKSDFIDHYLILFMDHDEKKEFAKTLVTQVEQSVLKVLQDEGIKIDEEAMKSISKRQYDSIQVMLENDSKLLFANPSLLFLIVMRLFQSPKEVYPKSRAEIYDYTVQSTLCSWKKKESSIKEDVLSNFLNNLAIYLHLQSPSGLIDEYDMKRLCYMVLKQQGVSNNHAELCTYVNKLISLLDSNIGMLAERGLQVFGFLHLSFQEYFVARGFVNGKIEEVAKRLITFAINSRFRESLLLALDWISWKKPFGNNDNFFKLLVAPTKDYAIPFGTLLFFAAFDQMQKLPSKSIMITALNTCLDHPSNTITEISFIPSLSSLPEEVIIEWMQLYLKDEKRLLKFCECLLKTLDDLGPSYTIDSSLIPSGVYRQLWTMCNINNSTEYVIDQTLRRIMMLNNAPKHIFNEEFYTYVFSNNISVMNIHPLILSVITAVCGGLRFARQEDDVINLHFSLEHLYRETSIWTPIINYFTNNSESHSQKIETIINEYESILQNYSPADTSLALVDTFIALICLQGLSQLSIYQKYGKYDALLLAIERFKRTWFYLNESRNSYQSNVYMSPNVSSIRSEIESILNTFFLQSGESNKERMLFPLACVSAWEKFGLDLPSDWLEFDILRTANLHQVLKCQPEFSHDTSEENQSEMTQNNHRFQMLHHQPLLFLLTFIPQSLQQIYYHIITDTKDKPNPRSLVLLLSQCLLFLENIDKCNPNFYLALSLLQPTFKQYNLENYDSILFWNSTYSSKSDRGCAEDFLNKMIDRMPLDRSLIDQPKDYQALIDLERQRISQGKDWQLFAASISLAQLFQARYCLKLEQMEDTIYINLLTTEINELYSTINSINDPVLQVVALSMILDMKNLSILDKEHRDKLREKMIILLQRLLPYLSILMSTLLFVRCYTVHQVFPIPFHQMAHMIGKKLNEMTAEKPSEYQLASYIALRQLNNSDLSYYLLKFEKRTMNIPGVLQFNSPIFFRYFINRSSFDSSNHVLLSSMYLIELAFDVQSMKIYTTNDHESHISSVKEIDQLSTDWLEDQKIMSFDFATWINNQPDIWTRQDFDRIVGTVIYCDRIEEKALSVIEKWLNYRMNENMKFLAYYTALQLLRRGSNISALVDIIEEMCLIDTKPRFSLTVKSLLNSRFIDLNVRRQILIIVNRNVYYRPYVRIRIDSKEIFQLILTLELKRIILNTYKSNQSSTNSFLLETESLSQDLQFYSVEYLRAFVLVDTHSEFQNTIKEEYLALTVKWIINNSIRTNKIENCSIHLYEYIFALLHDQRCPRVQKIILTAVNEKYLNFNVSEKHVLMQDDAINNFEKIIYFYDQYSEEVISECLLVYGNCQQNLKRLKLKRDLSSKIQNVLNILAEKSSSETISILAGFCLIYAQYPTTDISAILDWFRNKLNITVRMGYKILCEQFSYKRGYSVSSLEVNNIGSYIIKHCDEVMDTVVIDLHNDLCNKRNEQDLPFRKPDCIDIAMNIIPSNPMIFCDAVRRSSFGEEKFKRELYLYYKNNTRYGMTLIYFYARFGILTDELINMIEWFDKRSDREPRRTCSFSIHQVSNPGVLEKLFQLLNSVVCDTTYERLSLTLEIIMQLAKAGAVSLLEVHQRVSFAIDNFCYKSDQKRCSHENEIFGLLLTLSCFEHVFPISSFKELYTANFINMKFEEEIENREEKSILFPRRNFFINLNEEV